jgi:type I restriction enzyme M protein
MLTTDVKRHIDAARQVLVGVVPNPTSQIDQITNALIYKFMDDMDQDAIKAGGEPSFFVGELEKYKWTKLMDTRLGNQERMNLYVEAFEKFSVAKNLPVLFREILRGAYLPYRQPEVLGLFLNEINFFDYSHPEELGNAYEYLLSIMSSQGGAGQFRTPRHIIDFIVKIVDPSKDDRILDPACGTGGFLISAYKHILRKHDGKNEDGKPNDEKLLTPDDRKKLMQNFEGYDVDPGMVRIARVNMYLHLFKDPKIVNYNTLSSEERWKDKFDVVLANPPFMSPKGGVQPHNKFSVESNRSEVLFVDYIMHHLRPQGRAGIIVPEGIIFQSGSAYKQLRKNLVEDGLFAVVSLPSGVFNPYAGVKTSILLFDAEMGRQQKEILFVKIKNDGFDLGAQRREKAGSNLPEAARVLLAWRNGEKIESSLAQWVSREDISRTGDYNLSSDRYRVAVDYANTKWPMTPLDEIAIISKGSAITKKDVAQGGIPVIAGGQSPAYYHNEANRTGDVVTVSASGAYAGFVSYFDIPIFASDCSTVQAKDEGKVRTKYLFHVLKAKQDDLYALQQGGGQPHVYPKDLKKIKVPLPPLEIQEQVVKELDGYMGVIAGAKQIIQGWKPKININPEWPMIAIGELCDLYNGKAFKPSDWRHKESGGLPIVRIQNLNNEQSEYHYFTGEVDSRVVIEKGDLLFSWSGSKGSSFGPHIWNGSKAILNQHIFKVESKENVLRDFFFFMLKDAVKEVEENLHGGVGLVHITKRNLEKIKIPVPPMQTQKQIVEEVKAEQALVESSRKLIKIHEEKIRETIEKLWAQ